MAKEMTQQPSVADSGEVAWCGFAGELARVEMMPSLVRNTFFIGRGYNFDEKHALQVTLIAQKIFDDTRALHKLAAEDRNILLIGSMLHDIGICFGDNGHHKSSCNLIMKTSIPEVSREDILLAALIARYHRKSEPKPEHEFFAHLSDRDQKRVTALAAILRVADVLDRNHLQQVDTISVSFDLGSVSFLLSDSAKSGIDYQAFAKKSRLFAKVFAREVKIQFIEHHR